VKRRRRVTRGLCFAALGVWIHGGGVLIAGAPGDSSGSSRIAELLRERRQEKSVSPIGSPGNLDPWSGVSLVLHSTGNVEMFGPDRHHDRTFVFTPSSVDGRLQSLSVKIIDNENSGQETKGILSVDGDGRLSTTEIHMLKATTLLPLTPTELVKLRKSDETVTTQGQIDVNGEARDVTMTHVRVGGVSEGGDVTVRSRILNRDGSLIDLTTITHLGPQGLPISGETIGIIKYGIFKLKIRQNLVCTP